MQEMYICIIKNKEIQIARRYNLVRVELHVYMTYVKDIHIGPTYTGDGPSVLTSYPR